MKKKYVSNSEESVRMFKSDFLESLSKVHFTVPLYIFVPVIIFFIYEAFNYAIGFFTFVILFAAGLFVWSFVEYIMHGFYFTICRTNRGL